MKSKFIALASTVCFATGCLSVAQVPSLNEIVIPEYTNSAKNHVDTDDLLSIRDIGGVNGEISVSPDGERVAFHILQAVASENAYRTGWFVAKTDADQDYVAAGWGGEPILSGESNGMRLGAMLAPSAKWSPDGKWFAYLLKRDGEVQLWRSSVDGARQDQVTSNAGDVHRFEWSESGEHIYFQTGRPREEKAKALRREGEIGYLFDDRFMPFFSTEPVFDRADRADIFSSTSTAQVWIVDVATSTERITTKQERQAYELQSRGGHPDADLSGRRVQDIVVASNSAQFTWLENEDPKTFPSSGGPLQLYARLENGDEKRCAAPECTGLFGSVFWSHGEDEVLFFKRDGVSLSSLYLYGWRPGEKTVRTILKTDDLLEDCGLGGVGLICLHEDAITPRKIISLNTETGALRTVLDANPEFKNFQFTRVEKLEWKEQSGTDAVGHLVYPVGYEEGRRYPMVVVQYMSRGFLRGGVGDEYPIHPMAANGFFVLSFDRPFRSPEYTAHYEDRTTRAHEDMRNFWERDSALSALEIIIEKLDARGLIDSTRIGHTGLSDGAETVWYGLIHSDKFAAAAVSGGAITPDFFYDVNKTHRENWLIPGGLTPPESDDDAAWRHLSITYHKERIDTPILVQMADHEFQFGVPSISSLKDIGKPIEAHVFPDEYHIKSQPKHRQAVYNRNVQWFKFWFQDEEVDEPVDPDQYIRWRKLRDNRCAALKPDEKGPWYCQ